MWNTFRIVIRLFIDSTLKNLSPGIAGGEGQNTLNNYMNYTMQCQGKHTPGNKLEYDL